MRRYPYARFGFPAVRRAPLQTLQVNLGYKCNQSCLHCHVNAGPTRTEMMAQETIGDVMDFLAASSVKNLDITGGAPELHPHFRDLVQRARALECMHRPLQLTSGEPGRGISQPFSPDNAVEVSPPSRAIPRVVDRSAARRDERASRACCA